MEFMFFDVLCVLCICLVINWVKVLVMICIVFGFNFVISCDVVVSR